MKRARGNYKPKTTTQVVKKPKETKKMTKKAAAKEKEVAAAKKAAEEVAAVVEETAEMDDEYWAGLWSEVDEEISWANCWCPIWEMEAIGVDVYNALCEDVLWECEFYDIWDFRASANVAPNP